MWGLQETQSFTTRQTIAASTYYSLLLNSNPLQFSQKKTSIEEVSLSHEYMELRSRGGVTTTEEATINNNNKNTAATSSSSSSGGSNMNYPPNKKPNLAQYGADARLLSEFEQSVGSGKSFNYTALLKNEPKAVPEQEMTAYLERIQRGGFVQPFGCMVAIEEPTFRIISFSENCFSMLSLNPNSPPDDLNNPNNKRRTSLIGVDARTLFTSSSRASLERAMASREITLLNPIWVHSRTARKPFYAILHRIDVGVVIDLEPASSVDPTFLLAGAVHSQKLVVRAISRLQSLPGGDIGVLCDTVVEEVQKLTGYDRVMVYKFHDDEHGEVVSEIRRSDLEPYLGLHYPATDIPQAARFLFKQNRVRIIVDGNADPVQLVQSEELKQPLCLVNSTLRAPHGCHRVYMANMGSIGTLVMAIVINNNNESTKLWGLIACHHTSPRYIPFPLRYACEFLMQSMGLQLYMELQLAEQKTEKTILRTQTTLCNMLLRDAPYRIITQSPSIMDLIKCDGAALYHNGRVWLVGVTPKESEIVDISNWLCSEHNDSTGFSTESLLKAGYPGAVSLGDDVCGMAAAQITSRDFLFWFRSHTEKEIKWAGAKHDEDDDGNRMQPRSSFKAFLEVTKKKSLPWEVSEINVIYSLQLIMRTLDQDVSADEGGVGGSKKAVKHGQHSEAGLQGMDEISSIACEMGRLIETTSVPIFGVDASGVINGWNAKIAELTGVATSEAMGKSLIDEIVHESSRAVVQDLLSRALQGEEEKNVELKLQKVDKHQQNNTIIYIMANTCTSRDYKNNVVGVCFVGQDVTTEKIVMDKFIRMEGDYNTIIQTPNPLIPPLFASNENASCSEWNAAMEELTGYMRHEVIGKVLPGEVFGALCQLKSEDTLTKFMILLYRAINGHDTSDLPFGFFTKDGNLVEALLTANKRVVEGGKVVGCFCFLQTSSQWPLGKDEDFVLKSHELAYLKQEIKNPLHGLRFAHELLENTAVSYDQKQFLETSGACERQIALVIENMDIKSIEEGSVELNLDQFVMENLLDAVVSQVMILLKEKKIPLVHEIPDQVKTLALFGDQIRLQIVLSDFLLSIVHHAPSPDGWVEIKVSPGLRMIQDGHEFIHLQFRMSHPGPGLPVDIIRDMYDERKRWDTQEGLALNLSRKLLGIMKGNVNYVTDDSKCCFLIDIELKTRK